MPILNKKTIEKRTQLLTNRQQELQELISKPFDINNENMIDAIASYLNDFEWALHSSSVIDFVGACFLPMLTLKVVTFLFISSDLMNLMLGLTLLGLAWQRYHAPTFDEALDSMKQLYVWAVKTDYNDNKLLNPVIQKMVELMAPYCHDEFLIAWPKLIENEDRGILANAYAVAYKTFCLFARGSQEQIDNHKAITALKICVEDNKLELSTLERLKKAFEYFTTSPGSRAKYKDAVVDFYNNLDYSVFKQPVVDNAVATVTSMSNQ